MAALLSVCRPLPRVVHVTEANVLNLGLKNTQGCPAKTGQPYVFVDRAEYDGQYGIRFLSVADKVYACKLKQYRFTPVFPQ